MQAVFQSLHLGYATWLDKPLPPNAPANKKPDTKKIKFQRGIYQTSDEAEIEFLKKDKNVVMLKPAKPDVEAPVTKDTSSSLEQLKEMTKKSK